MKTMTKKLGSVVLALCLCFSLCCTAFAASSTGDEPTYGSITIDGYVGEEYTIYQILHLTYSDSEPTSYSYVVPDEWYDFLSGYPDYFTLISVESTITYIDPSSPIFTEGAGGLDMAEFAKAAVAYAVEKEIEGQTATAEKTDDSVYDPDTNTTTGTATFTGLALGYYVVSSSIGTVCSLDSTTPDVTINDKNEVPVVHKYLVDTDYDEHWDATGDEEGHKKDEGDNKDTMEYKLVVDNVGNIKNLVIHDYLDPDQLDANTLKIKSIVLYNSTDATDGTDITESCMITPSTCNNGENCGMIGCSFEIDIPDSILDGDGVGRDAYIVVLYDISLNESVDKFVDDVDEIDNYVNITFGARAVGVPEEVQTYSYGFKIFKYTEEGEDKTPLAGAEFIISKTSGESTVYAMFTPDEESGIYLFDSWVESQDDATALVSDAEGIIHVDGLHDGSFTVTETKAPDGYNKLNKSIEVTLTVTNEDLGSFTVFQDGNAVSDHQVSVLNNQGSILPGTGGMGTTLFYIVGIILIAGAAVVLISRRRMNSAE